MTPSCENSLPSPAQRGSGTSAHQFLGSDAPPSAQYCQYIANDDNNRGARPPIFKSITVCALLVRQRHIH